MAVKETVVPYAVKMRRVECDHCGEVDAAPRLDDVLSRVERVGIELGMQVNPSEGWIQLHLCANVLSKNCLLGLEARDHHVWLCPGCAGSPVGAYLEVMARRTALGEAGL